MFKSVFCVFTLFVFSSLADSKCLMEDGCRYDIQLSHQWTCDKISSERNPAMEGKVATLQTLFENYVKTGFQKSSENDELKSKVNTLENSMKTLSNVMENEKNNVNDKLAVLESKLNQSDALLMEVEESLNKALLENRRLLLSLVETQERTRAREEELKNVQQSLQGAKEEMEKCSDQLTLVKGQQKDCAPDPKIRMAFDKIWYARTCRDWLDMSATENGEYQIDPDGPGIGLDPFDVYCDFYARNNTAVAMIFHHTAEKKTKVEPACEMKKCYQREIRYRQDIKQIAAAMKLTAVCEQFIKYDCFGSQMLLSYPDTALAAWYSRDGDEMTYWGGASQGSGMCGCGTTGTCDVKTAWATGKCNCDNNDREWREDSGYLTDKCTLPVTKIAFGDVSEGEEGYHTLGPLVCYTYNYEIENDGKL